MIPTTGSAAAAAIVHDLRRAEITPMLRAIALRSRARLDAIAGRVEAVEAGLTNAAALFREIGQYRGSGRSSKISATGSSLRGETGRLRLSWRSQETSTSVWRLNPRRRVVDKGHTVAIYHHSSLESARCAL
ncbi:MAG TPA: hypothetical protein VFF07_16825 [Actinomycetota bacterium]|nr:hypothetical protein [Actinomycetota bacterium]